jgi:hypothetical protein
LIEVVAMSSGSSQTGDYDLGPPVQGWPSVAALMVRKPHMAAFSRFGDLNVKSLLYYQAQLTRLRKELHDQEKKDRDGAEEDPRLYASRADFLTDPERSENLEQFTIIKSIRKLLKEYSELLPTLC